MPELTLAAARLMKQELFAPWVQAMGFEVEALDPSGRAVLRLPFDPALARVGGTVCGQALMALADSAMVFAVSAAFGEFRPMTTVTQTTSFMRAVSGGDILARARVAKLGRTMAFGEVSLEPSDGGECFASVVTTYAIVPVRS